MVPLLMDDLTPTELTPPLGLFNAQRWNKQGTWQLVRSININLKRKLAEDRLLRILEVNWSRLEEQFQSIPEPSESDQVQPRDPSDMLEEILEVVRSMSAILDRMYARERRSERMSTSRSRRPVVHTDEGDLLVDPATGHVIARLGGRRSEADDVIRDAAEVFDATRHLFSESSDIFEQAHSEMDELLPAGEEQYRSDEEGNK